jgi:hypothetical protein
VRVRNAGRVVGVVRYVDGRGAPFPGALRDSPSAHGSGFPAKHGPSWGPGEASPAPGPQRNGGRPDHDSELQASRSPATARKVRNLYRHPTATLCVFTDNFFGPWTQIDGTTEIVPLPQAMDGLIDYHRRISGEHPDWDDYRRAMVDEQRVLIRLTIDNVGPPPLGSRNATPRQRGSGGRDRERHTPNPPPVR